jgi:hypothetical protein
MLIKRNSEEFKKLREIIEAHKKDPFRMKWIRMYSLKPSADLKERVLLNSAKNGGDIIYSMQLDTVLFNFLDAKHKLFKDENTGIYYFKPSSKSDFIESPFDLAGKLKKELEATIDE